MTFTFLTVDENSKHFNDYVFENMMNASDDAQVQFTALRDDQLELHLFQTNSLQDNVDWVAINSTYHIDGNTLPTRSANAIGWAYGDKREIIAVSQALSKAVEKYCQNRVGGIYNARMDDDACSDSNWPFPQGFPNYHSSFDIALQLLASYGISGDITLPTITSYGTEASISLISATETDQSSFPVPSVRFCTPLPPSSVYNITDGMDFSRHIANVGASCTGKRRGLLHTLPTTGWTEAKFTRKSIVDHWPFDSGNILLRGLLDNISSVHPNPLNLALMEVGVDDKGYWLCYDGSEDPSSSPDCYSSKAQWYYNSFNSSDVYGYQGAVFVAVDVTYSVLNAVGSSLSNAGLEIRYRLDSLSDPDCSGTFQPVDGSKKFEYSSKVRLVLFNSSAQLLQVWVCNSTGSPNMVSVLNIASALSAIGVAPLQPGPSLTLTVPLSTAIDSPTTTRMQNYLCVIAFGAVNEKCKFRVWSAADSSSINFAFLGSSNSGVTKMSYNLQKSIQSDAFRSSFPAASTRVSMVFSRVYAPVASKLNRQSQQGCVTHYDCDDGLFCSTKSLMPYSQDFLGAGGPGPYGFGCDLCKYCLNDFFDPVDVYCPRDKCGLTVGMYPSCVDGTKLFSPNFTCPSRYTINMSRVTQSQTSDNLEIPLSSPNSSVRKARFLTPYNQLMGAMTISQRRLKGNCSAKNDSIGRYTTVDDASQGLVCRGSVRSTDPFGSDPAFSGSSSLYRGDISASTYYKDWEISDDGHPYAFYPHFYDGVTGTTKPNQDIVKEEADSFKVYLPERISAVQADRMLRFLIEGGFLDSGTEQVSVDFVTLNSNLNIFSTFTFYFVWEDGGRVTWDYHFSSVPVYPYDGSDYTGRMFLEFLCMAMLCVENIKEISEMLYAVKMFRLKIYFGDVWNLFDLCHFGLQWTGWYLWLRQVSLAANLKVPKGFPVLKSFSTDTPARLILTNADSEREFLKFRSDISDMVSNLEFYNVVTSICVVLFVLRILKDADFQPRIALVTRTIANVVSDLGHFFLLFSIILIGYAIAGVQLFGHQYDGFSTINHAIFYLLMIIIAFNPDAGWVQMNHAAPEWAFNVFLWTWIMIGMFILLNIFLAILINGYTAMHEASATDSGNMLVELYDIIYHEINKIIRFIFPRYPFVSDEDIIKRLATQVGDVHFEETLQQYHQIAVAELMEIQSRQRPGQSLKVADVLQVLQAYFPDHVADVNLADDLYVNPTLRNIMKRFGSMVQVKPTKEIWSEKETQFIRRLELENAKRIALAELKDKGNRDEALVAAATIKSKGKSPVQASQFAFVRLSVVVEKMRGLPRMDIFHGADPYCVIFLEDYPGMFQTVTKRGKDENDWTWDPRLSDGFCWELSNDVYNLRSDRKIVIMVYDKDRISADDLIGCATVELSELVDGPFDGWKPIARPPHSTSSLAVLFKGTIPEVKLQVRLAGVEGEPSVDHAAKTESKVPRRGKSSISQEAGSLLAAVAGAITGLFKRKAANQTKQSPNGGSHLDMEDPSNHDDSSGNGVRANGAVGGNHVVAVPEPPRLTATVARSAEMSTVRSLRDKMSTNSALAFMTTSRDATPDSIRRGLTPLGMEALPKPLPS